jgi:DNA modification methylase
MAGENNIQILLNSGFDAFSNLYKVDLKPPAGKSIEDFKEIRIADFKAPEMKLGEYPQHFKTASITRLNALITGEREFSLTFRIDSDWKLYENLKKWRKLYFNIGTDQVFMGAYSSIGTPYGEVVVKVFKGTDLQNGVEESNYAEDVIWSYKNVILYDLTEPSLKRSGSEPVTVTGKFLFGEYSSTTSKLTAIQ